MVSPSFGLSRSGGTLWTNPSGRTTLCGAVKYPLKHYALTAAVILMIVFVVSPDAALFLVELVVGISLAVLLVFMARVVWTRMHHKPHTSH